MKPNRMLMIALCAVIVSGCTTTKHGASQGNKDLLRRFYDEVFIHWNLAVVDEMVAPQFRSHDWPDNHASGPQGFRDFYGWLPSAFPDLRYTVEDLIAGSDRVVVRWRQDGTHQGDFLGVAATGRPMTMRGIAIYRVEDGKLMERWVVVDLHGLLERLQASAPAAGGEPVLSIQRLEANRDLLRRAHAEVWSQGHLAAADELYAPDYVCHFIAGSEWKGLEGLKAEVRRHRTSFPDGHEHIEQIVTEGDYVMTRFTCTGTQLGVFNGLPPTGKAVKMFELGIHRIANGKIAEQWGCPDVLILNQQLGIASDESRFCTGGAYPVDGAMSAR